MFKSFQNLSTISAFEEELQNVLEKQSGKQDQKSVKSFLDDVFSVKSYLEKFLDESTILSVDLDKCLELNESMTRFWNKFKHSTYMTLDTLEVLIEKQYDTLSIAHIHQEPWIRANIKPSIFIIVVIIVFLFLIISSPSSSFSSSSPSSSFSSSSPSSSFSSSSPSSSFSSSSPSSLSSSFLSSLY